LDPFANITTKNIGTVPVPPNFPPLPTRYLSLQDKSNVQAAAANSLYCNISACCIQNLVSQIQTKYPDSVFNSLSPFGQQHVQDLRTNVAQFLAHTNRISGVDSSALINPTNNLPSWLAFKLKTYNDSPFAAVFNSPNISAIAPVQGSNSAYSAILTPNIGTNGNVVGLTTPSAIFNVNFPVIYTPAGLSGQGIKAIATSLNTGGQVQTISITDIGTDILSSYILSLKTSTTDCNPQKYKNVEVSISSTQTVASIISLPTECGIPQVDLINNVGTQAELLNLGGSGIGFRGTILSNGVIQINNAGRNYSKQTCLSVRKPFEKPDNVRAIDVMPEFTNNNKVTYDFCVRPTANGYDISPPIIGIPCGNEIACHDASNNIGLDPITGHPNPVQVSGTYASDGSIDLSIDNPGSCYKNITSLLDLSELLKLLQNYAQIKNLATGPLPLDTSSNNPIDVGPPTLPSATDCDSYCIQDRANSAHEFGMEVFTSSPWMISKSDQIIGDLSGATATISEPLMVVANRLFIVVTKIQGVFIRNESLSLVNKIPAWALCLNSAGRYVNGQLQTQVDLNTLPQDDKMRLLCCLNCNSTVSISSQTIYIGTPLDGRTLSTITDNNSNRVINDPNNLIDPNLFNVTYPPQTDTAPVYLQLDNSIPTNKTTINRTAMNTFLDRFGLTYDQVQISTVPEISNLIRSFQNDSMDIASYQGIASYSSSTVTISTNSNFKPHQLVKISNSNINNGIFTVKEVSLDGETLTLSEMDSLNIGSDSNVTIQAIGVYTSSRLRFDVTQNIIVDYSNNFLIRGIAVGQKIQIFGGLNTGFIFTVIAVSDNLLKVKSDSYTMVSEVEGSPVSILYIPTLSTMTPQKQALNNQQEFVACYVPPEVSQSSFTGGSLTFTPIQSCMADDPCAAGLVVDEIMSSSSTTVAANGPTNPYSASPCIGGYVSTPQVLFDDSDALSLPAPVDVFTKLWGSLLIHDNICQTCSDEIQNAGVTPSSFDCQSFVGCINKLCAAMSSDNYFSDLFSRAVATYEKASMLSCSDLHKFFIAEISCATPTPSSSTSCSVVSFSSDSLLSSSSGSRVEFQCPP